MSKFKFILLMVGVIVIFSCMTLFEIWLLKKLGFDLFAHMQATYVSGKGTKFMFEAFGVLAFMIGQPVILVCLLVWAVKNLLPIVADSLIQMFTNFMGGD